MWTMSMKHYGTIIGIVVGFIMDGKQHSKRRTDYKADMQTQQNVFFHNCELRSIWKLNPNGMKVTVLMLISIN